MFVKNLIAKARALLKLLYNRFYTSEDDAFLPPQIIRHYDALDQVAQKETEETIFEVLRRTYLEIAENDPEAALRLIKEEIEARPPPQIRTTLMEIEKDIRKRHSGEYFRGFRN